MCCIAHLVSPPPPPARSLLLPPSPSTVFSAKVILQVHMSAVCFGFAGRVSHYHHPNSTRRAQAEGKKPPSDASVIGSLEQTLSDSKVSLLQPSLLSTRMRALPPPACLVLCRGPVTADVCRREVVEMIGKVAQDIGDSFYKQPSKCHVMIAYLSTSTVPPYSRSCPRARRPKHPERTFADGRPTNGRTNEGGCGRRRHHSDHRQE